MAAKEIEGKRAKKTQQDTCWVGKHKYWNTNIAQTHSGTKKSFFLFPLCVCASKSSSSTSESEKSYITRLGRLFFFLLFPFASFRFTSKAQGKVPFVVLYGVRSEYRIVRGLT